MTQLQVNICRFGGLSFPNKIVLVPKELHIPALLHVTSPTTFQNPVTFGHFQKYTGTAPICFSTSSPTALVWWCGGVSTCSVFFTISYFSWLFFPFKTVFLSDL